MTKNNFYITTPIYYVNDIPHLGHAYTSIATDTIARYKKLNNFKVFFSTGTDEHGQKVEDSAKSKNLDTKTFADNVSERFKKLTDKLLIENNDFIRTTEKRHKDKVKNVWNKLLSNGEIYLSNYEGWYSVRDESFINENDIIFDKDNNRIGPSKDILKKVKEPSYFFKLSKWQKPLLDFYKKNESFVKPKSRFNEVKSFVERGLDDLSISRTSFKWGISVPGNNEHVIYVWLDALLNYLSVLGEESSENFKNYWPADVHVVGKDILRFHAIYWPAFLLAAEYKIPKNIFAHGWWTINGEKMSKSLGNVIDPNYLVDKYGVDQVRYFLLREIPFGEDGNFSEDLLTNRINSELANDYGNLVQRVISMAHKYCNGVVPQQNKYNHEDLILSNLPKKEMQNIEENMKNLQFNNALENIWNIIRKTNAYVDANEPWALHKNNKLDRLNTVLNVLLNSIYKIAILAQPYLPISSNNVLKHFNFENKLLYKEILTNLRVGLNLNKPKAIFPRILKD